MFWSRLRMAKVNAPSADVALRGRLCRFQCKMYRCRCNLLLLPSGKFLLGPLFVKFLLLLLFGKFLLSKTFLFKFCSRSWPQRRSAYEILVPPVRAVDNRCRCNRCRYNFGFYRQLPPVADVDNL